MKSYVAKPCDVNRKWYVVDAKDVVLGRLATEVASILRGKKMLDSNHHSIWEIMLLLLMLKKLN